jgi:hypothetical protein
MALQEFYKTGDVFISNDEAWYILVWFFGGNAGSMPSTLTYNDKSFAQALIFEAIGASKKIAFIESLWKKTIKPPASILKFLKSIARMAAKELWKYLSPADLEDPKIYQMVKDEITRNWRHAWQIRVETDSPVY